MPTINVTGKKPAYTADTRRTADYENRDYDLRARKAAASENAAARAEKATAAQRARDTVNQARLDRQAAAEKARATAHQAKAEKQKATDAARATATQTRLDRQTAALQARTTAHQHRQAAQAASQQARTTAQAARQATQATNATNRQAAAAARQQATQGRQAAAQQATAQRQAAAVQAAAQRQATQAANTVARQQAAQQRTQAAAAARQNPNSYVVNGIGGIGGQGGSAAAGGNLRGRWQATRQLNRIERRTQAAMRGATPGRRAELTSRLGRVAEARAEIAGGSELAGLSGIGAGRALGYVGIAAQAAYQVGKAYFGLPGTLANYASSGQAASAPYRGLKYGAADLGRANNFEGSDLVQEFYRGKPGWMQELGLSPQDAMGIATNSGMPFNSAAQASITTESIARSNRMRGLAGMGTDRLGQSLNLANTLGIADGSGQTSSAMTPDSYSRLISKAVARGTAMGFDPKQTLGNLEGLFRQAASAGATRVDASSLSSQYMGMAAGGAAGARTGEAQASVQAGYQSFIEGFGTGGGNTQAMVIQSRAASMGGLPKDRDGLAKFFHMSPDQLHKFESTEAGKLAVDRMLEAGQNGSSFAFSEYAKPLLSGNTAIARQMYDESPSAQSLPGYMKDIGGGIAMGSGTANYGQSAPGFASTTQGRGGSAAERALLDTIAGGESKGYNTLNGGKTFDGDQYPFGAHRAAGRYQFEPDTWREASKALGLTDFSPESQDKAALWLARNRYKRSTGGDLTTDLEDPSKLGGIAGGLNGTWPSLPGGSQQNAVTGSFGDRYGRNLALEGATVGDGPTATNDTSGENRADARTGTLLTQKGEQANAVDVATTGGAAGGLMVSLSEGVVKSTTALMSFTSALDGLVNWVNGRVQASNGYIPGAGPRTQAATPRMSP